MRRSLLYLAVIVLGATTWYCDARLADADADMHQHQQPVDPCGDLHCFHQPESACPPRNATCRCRLMPRCNRAVICCDITSETLNDSFACANVTALTANGQVEAIHIRNATLDRLSMARSEWRRLEHLSVTDGWIENVSGEFAKYAQVSCLNLSSNGISHFENRSLVNLFNLSYLDLSRNNLSDVPRFKNPSGMVTVDIHENPSMLCTSLYDAMKRQEHLQFVHRNTTECLSSRTFHWFNSTEIVQLEQVELMHRLRTNCTAKCSCEPMRLDIIPGKSPTFSVSVNCAGQNLDEFPTPLPANTVVLNVTNNNLTSLDPLKEDASYQNLRQLYVDNNQITSILPLEGTQFISSFVALSLKNNKLRTLPTYVLSNIFDRNDVSRMINLGQNRLLCDCNTAKVVKVWLLSKQKHIKDYDEIYCENMNVRVIELDPLKLCQSQQDWTDYIFYIITLEILLFVCLITKVSYDYWVFKTAGYLPWPANKMPKLPCDWLYE